MGAGMLETAQCHAHHMVAHVVKRRWVCSGGVSEFAQLTWDMGNTATFYASSMCRQLQICAQFRPQNGKAV